METVIRDFTLQWETGAFPGWPVIYCASSFLFTGSCNFFSMQVHKFVTFYDRGVNFAPEVQEIILNKDRWSNIKKNKIQLFLEVSIPTLILHYVLKFENYYYYYYFLI
jgi:hypothetical protein